MLNSKPSQATSPIAAIMPNSAFQWIKCISAAPESGPTIGATSTMEVITAISLIDRFSSKASCTVT